MRKLSSDRMHWFIIEIRRIFLLFRRKIITVLWMHAFSNPNVLPFKFISIFSLWYFGITHTRALKQWDIYRKIRRISIKYEVRTTPTNSSIFAGCLKRSKLLLNLKWLITCILPSSLPPKQLAKNGKIGFQLLKSVREGFNFWSILLSLG